MRRFAAGSVSADQGSINLFSDFDSGGEMWAGQGPRERRLDITFENAFSDAPLVHISLSMFDADSSNNQRFDLGAENITTKGFTIVFKTWGDSRIARARANWLAIGEQAPAEEEWMI